MSKRISKDVLAKLHKLEVPASLKSKKQLATVGSPTKAKLVKGRAIKMIGKIPPKVKVVKPTVRKPQKCFIYRGYLKEYPHISLTQVRFHSFDYLEDCIVWCKEHLLTWEIKDEKGTKILATNDSESTTTPGKTTSN